MLFYSTNLNSCIVLNVYKKLKYTKNEKRKSTTDRGDERVERVGGDRF